MAFLLGPVSMAHRGTYRCFGSYNNHAWSFPSEPMRLLVTGEETPHPLRVLLEPPAAPRKAAEGQVREEDRRGHPAARIRPFPGGRSSRLSTGHMPQGRVGRKPRESPNPCSPLSPLPGDVGDSSLAPTELTSSGELQ